MQTEAPTTARAQTLVARFPLDAGSLPHREVARTAVSTLPLVGSGLSWSAPRVTLGLPDLTTACPHVHVGTHTKGTSMQGSIVRLVRDRGFGFIKAENGSEVFFHATGVTGSTPYDALSEGQIVSYDKEQDTRGRGERAVNVQPS
jgi:CspA family cold shock protein